MILYYDLSAFDLSLNAIAQSVAGVSDVSLSQILANYETVNALNATLSNFETLADLHANYVSNTSLSTTLSNYATKSDLNNISTNVDLTGYKNWDDTLAYLDLTYFNKTVIIASFQDYIITSQLPTYISSWGFAKTVDISNAYVKNAILNSYAKTVDISNAYVKNAILNSYAKLTDISSFITSSALTPYAKFTDLSNIVLSSANVDLSGYVSKPYLLANYVSRTDFEPYVQDIILSNDLITSNWLIPYAKLTDISNFVTNTTFTSTLSSYVTQSVLNSILSSYVNVAALNYYISDLSNNYVRNTSLTSTLSNYVTNSSLTSTLSSYATTASLSNYVSNSSLISTLSSYAKSTDISSFVTNSSLTSTLASYATTASLSNYVSNSSLTTNYYTKTDTSNNFLKITDASNNYVSNSSLTSTLANYATTASLSAYATISSLSAYASKSVANTFSAMQTFTSGLTVSGSTSYVRDISASGLITANGGIKVPAGQTLDISGATVIANNTINTIYVTGSITVDFPTTLYNHYIFTGASAASTLTFRQFTGTSTVIGQYFKVTNATGYSQNVQVYGRLAYGGTYQGTFTTPNTTQAIAANNILEFITNGQNTAAVVCYIGKVVA